MKSCAIKTCPEPADQVAVITSAATGPIYRCFCYHHSADAVLGRQAVVTDLDPNDPGSWPVLRSAPASLEPVLPMPVAVVAAVADAPVAPVVPAVVAPAVEPVAVVVEPVVPEPPPAASSAVACRWPGCGHVPQSGTICARDQYRFRALYGSLARLTERDVAEAPERWEARQKAMLAADERLDVSARARAAAPPHIVTEHPERELPVAVVAELTAPAPEVSQLVDRDAPRGVMGYVDETGSDLLPRMAPSVSGGTAAPADTDCADQQPVDADLAALRVAFASMQPISGPPVDRAADLDALRACVANCRPTAALYAERIAELERTIALLTAERDEARDDRDRALAEALRCRQRSPARIGGDRAKMLALLLDGVIAEAQDSILPSPFVLQAIRIAALGSEDV